MRFRRRLGFAALVAVASGACFSEAPDGTGPDGGGAADVVVEMTPALKFSPASVEVRVGQTVRWHNASTFAHTATGDPARAADPAHVALPAGAAPWHSELLGPGQTYDYTPTVAGTYDYICEPHEGAAMFGTIVVTE